MRVLSVVHDPAVTGGGGLFERVVVVRGDHLDRWVVANGDAALGDPGRWDAVMVFGGAMHPDQDAEHTCQWPAIHFDEARAFFDEADGLRELRTDPSPRCGWHGQ